MNSKGLQSIVFILKKVAMFTTTLRDKLFGPVSCGGSDEVTTWRRMTIELQDPYYVVEYQLSVGDTLIDETVIVHFLDDLFNICKQANEDSRLRIISVQILSPKRINETSSWKLEELREIWRHSDNVSDQLTFVTSCGTRRDWRRHAGEKNCSEPAALIWQIPASSKYVV